MNKRIRRDEREKSPRRACQPESARFDVRSIVAATIDPLADLDRNSPFPPPLPKLARPDRGVRPPSAPAAGFWISANYSVDLGELFCCSRRIILLISADDFADLGEFFG